MSKKYEIRIIRFLQYIIAGFLFLFGSILIIVAISNTSREMIVMGTEITGTKTAMLIGLGIGIVLLILGYVFYVAGSELGKETSKGWKMMMVIEALSIILGVFSINPFTVIPSAVIMYYLWVARKIFGIKKDQTIIHLTPQNEQIARKIFGFIANLFAMPGYGQAVVGRTRTGVKLYLGFIVSVICMVAVSGTIYYIFDSVLFMAISGAGFFILFIGIYFYALYNVIIGDVIPFEGSTLEMIEFK